MKAKHLPKMTLMTTQMLAATYSRLVLCFSRQKFSLWNVICERPTKLRKEDARCHVAVKSEEKMSYDKFEKYSS